MSRLIMQQALDALKYHTEHTYPFHLTNVAIEALQKALAQPEQEVCVCCGDYEKCFKACTPRGRWLAEKELAHLEQVDYEKLTAKFGEQAKEYLVAAKKSWEPNQRPVAWLHPDKKVDVIAPTILGWFDKPVPLYTAPPRKEWVGLTDDEVHDILNCKRGGWVDIKKVEQILKDKNS
jgi:hypothetical protein